jgi:hypothetical protein
MSIRGREDEAEDADGRVDFCAGLEAVEEEEELDAAAAALEEEDDEAAAAAGVLDDCW